MKYNVCIGFQDVTANEFNVLMELLGTTRLGKTISGHQELVDLVAEQVELDQPFNPGADEEAELLDRLINCVRHALPYFSVSYKGKRKSNHSAFYLIKSLFF